MMIGWIVLAVGASVGFLAVGIWVARQYPTRLLEERLEIRHRVVFVPAGGGARDVQALTPARASRMEIIGGVAHCRVALPEAPEEGEFLVSCEMCPLTLGVEADVSAGNDPLWVRLACRPPKLRTGLERFSSSS